MKYIENKYYNLKQLKPIVNLNYRELLKRVKVVSNKYNNQKHLIYKKSNEWNIHSSLIELEFSRKRRKIEYKLFTTINSKNSFDKEYWQFIIHRLYNKLKCIDNSVRVRYVIELKDKSYHLHFKTTFDNSNILRNTIKNDELTDKTNDMNIYTISVYYLKGLYKYFRKQYKPILLK